MIRRLTHTLSSALVLLTAAHALPSQVASALSADLVAPSPLAPLSTVTRAGVFAGPHVRSLPAGETIPRPVALAVEAPGAAARLSAAPLVGDSSFSNLPVVGAAFGWSGRAAGVVATDLLTSTDTAATAAGTTGTGNPAPSPQTWCLMLPPTGAGHGTLLIEFKGAIVNRAWARALVAIGDREIRFEATHDGTARRILVERLGTGRGLPVKITLEGFAHGSPSTTGPVAPGAFEAALALRFSPDAPAFCSIAPDRRGCPRGGELSGVIVRPDTDSRAHIGLSLQGALPNAIGVTVLSRTGDLGQFPFTPCPILLMPTIAAVFRTDADGNARTVLPAPPVAGDFRFFIQQITILFGDSQLLVASSNTLAVKCWHPVVSLR